MSERKYLNPNSEQFFAFNIWSIDSAKAVIDAAVSKHTNIILQTSMQAFSKIDKLELRNFVSNYSKRNKVSVFLHLDHCKKKEMFIEAINAGWDSVMIDASDCPLQENFDITNEICVLAHANNVLVESEIGHIAGVEDGVGVTQGGIAELKNIETFIKNTDIDFLAVAIGTAHGLYHGKPELHYELLEETGKISTIPLVIHGGTGLSDDMFRKLLAYQNVKKINISTDVKQAYLNGILYAEKSQFLKSEGFDPLKVEAGIHDSIMQMASHYLDLQNGVIS